MLKKPSSKSPKKSCRKNKENEIEDAYGAVSDPNQEAPIEHGSKSRIQSREF